MTYYAQPADTFLFDALQSCVSSIQQHFLYCSHCSLPVLYVYTILSSCQHCTEHHCRMSAHLQYVLDDRQKVCDTCGHSFKPKGFDRHQRACERQARESEEDAELWASIPPVQGQRISTTMILLTYSLYSLQLLCRPWPYKLRTSMASFLSQLGHSRLISGYGLQY